VTIERPIIFSGEMVRAILSGTKTQTRRVVNMRDLSFIGGRYDDPNDPSKWGFSDECGRWHVLDRSAPAWYGHEGSSGDAFRIKCHYGDVGDRLWVKEAWAAVWPGEDQVPLRECRIEYRADLPPGNNDGPGEWPADMRSDPDAPRWRSPLYMPRWASRITLEIVGVRVERIAAITEEDARSEGVAPMPRGLDDMRPHVGAFHMLWDKINSKRTHHDPNPWVWVLVFRRVPT
jgi:hypothetical protein